MTACVAISDFWMFKYKPALTQRSFDSYLLPVRTGSIEEGLAHFDKIDASKSAKNYNMIILQQRAFYRLEIDKAEKIAKSYENYSIDRWKKLPKPWHMLASQGGAQSKSSGWGRAGSTDGWLADTEPSFSFEFVDDQIRLEHKISECTGPVLSYGSGTFLASTLCQKWRRSFHPVSPDGEDAIKIGKGTKQTTYRLPEKYRRQNVMIEIEAERKAEVYYANRLNRKSRRSTVVHVYWIKSR